MENALDEGADVLSADPEVRSKRFPLHFVPDARVPVIDFPAAAVPQPHWSRHSSPGHVTATLTASATRRCTLRRSGAGSRASRRCWHVGQVRAAVYRCDVLLLFMDVMFRSRLWMRMSGAFKDAPIALPMHAVPTSILLTMPGID
eukprot:959450-Rhodomonas_salina.1